MIVFMGVAGAGKSVQGTLLAKDIGYTWLSTGEYLRASISGERKAEMLRGKLLDDQEIIDILIQFFDSIEDTEHSILDGFPRTLRQAEWLYEQHETGAIKVTDVIYLDASLEVVEKRLIARGRPDDTEEVIHRRFEEYEKATLPIIDWFKQKGLRVHEVNAERSVDEIHGDIMQRIGRA